MLVMVSSKYIPLRSLHTLSLLFFISTRYLSYLILNLSYFFTNEISCHFFVHFCRASGINSRFISNVKIQRYLILGHMHAVWRTLSPEDANPNNVDPTPWEICIYMCIFLYVFYCVAQLSLLLVSLLSVFVFFLF